MSFAYADSDCADVAAPRKRRVAIVGAGFTGLSAAWELANSGVDVVLIEKDASVGGLAAGFPVGGTILEKFYHHWFNNDTHITGFVRELGLGSNLIERRTRTGMYYARSFYRLSTPLDVLKFTALPLIDRFRLALLVLQARRVRDWRALESTTAREWLLSLCGKNVYRVVWEPLMRGKFGGFADDISAVWLWNKLCLRGGSRDNKGNEVLLYYRGGFAALTADISTLLTERGVTLRTSCEAIGVEEEAGRITAVVTTDGRIECDAALFTAPMPITQRLLEPWADTQGSRAVRYLANICLILRLNRSLSDLYWINVNDPSFPFVGVIEHTNFEPPETYAGQHIVYLSRYLPADDITYRMTDTEYLAYALPFVRQMFPDFDEAWIHGYHVWRADHAQPVVERNYSSMVPPEETTLQNAFISTMAHIYPEDRGTNYAIREGRAIAKRISSRVHKGASK